LELNLIRVFTFYLAIMFVVGTLRRLNQYHDIGRLVASAPGRWPRVMKQIKAHGVMFFTWATLRPALLVLVMLIAQSICSNYIWPQSNINTKQLLGEWWMWPFVGIATLSMIAVDMYFIIRVGVFDRKETEKYLDEAEHWLTSWKAPMISAVTFGYLNPRKIVDDEVKKALEQGRGLLHSTLWWVVIQSSCRLLCGLSLWLSWAFLPTTDV